MLFFRTSTRDRMELWCDGVEKPQHVLPILPKLLVMNEERFLVPRADLWLAQVFLVCCPNAPEGEDAPKLDRNAILSQPGKPGSAHWFAQEMLRK